MKESHLYQRNEQNMARRLSEAGQKNSLSLSFKNQLMDAVFKMMQFIVQAEQRIQIYKEMLTERNDFSPQPLFYWVSRDENQIDKRHLISLFEENLITLQQDYIKLYFNSYGGKDKVDYSTFINFIFPQNTDLIKYISVTGIKKYSNHSALNEDVLCIFLMLVQEEIRLLQGLEALKNQLISKITRKEVKNLMRIMKKNGQCNSLMEIDSRPFVKYQELKALFKNYISKSSKVGNMSKKTTMKSVQTSQDNQNNGLYSFLERNSLAIFRKLSMGKTNFINLQDFQFWLRPWNKQRSSLNVGQECASNIFTISAINEIDGESKVSLGENIDLPISHRAG